MSFLQQTFLWGLFAACIPIIIHLLNRRRHRTVQWAAMDFLLKATRESRGKKKLKYLIILTCRALAIAALIFAIARPLIGGFLGWGGGNVDTVIFILDRSASMEQQSIGLRKSKRSSAIASVRESLKELNSPRLILIDSATATPQEVSSPDALEELSSTFATDTKSSIPNLISKAIDYVADHPVGRTEIWLASDLQVSDWSPEESSWDAVRTGIKDLPQKTTIRVLSLTSPPTDNFAIRVLSSLRSADSLVLDLELMRSEAEGPVSVPITYSLNGSLSSDTVTLNGQTYQFQKRLPLNSTSSSGYGFVSIPSDTLSRDNSSYFAYGKDTPATTFLVSEGGESPDWLKLAAAPPGFDQSQAIRIPANKAHKINWASATLIIWQAPLPDGTIAEELTRYIESGGAALILPPLRESPHSFMGFSWGEQTTSSKGQYFIVSDWDQTDGPLRNGLEGTQIAVPKMKAILRRKLTGEGTALASWDDEEPFLVRKVSGDGCAIFMTTLPDYTWSNLADADVLLPIVQRMLARGETRFGSAFSAITGSQKATISDGEARRRLDTHSQSTSTNAPYEAGVWQLGDRLLATNRPQSEDEWQILTQIDLDKVFAGVPYQLFEDSGESQSLAREIWKALLIVMLVCLITEAALCLQPKPQKAQ